MCINPGHCQCDLGWTGQSCDTCIEHPNCVMGRCIDQPYQCKCFDGYEGTYCENSICTKGCHPEHVIFQYLLIKVILKVYL